MKNLIRFMLISFFAFLGTAAFAQEEIIVTSDQNLVDGEFDQYKTFTFAKHIEDENNNKYFWENESMKSVLKEEIRANMQAMNYEYVEGSGADADLVVNFQVLKEDTELTGWENVDATFDYWGFEVVGQDRDFEDQTTYDVKKGTVMIHMADAEEGVEVWRGFASGIIDDTELTEADEIKIGEAVDRIFDEYNHTASR